jgi:alkanesulfonate monooxygenase SsuD/methylene tetrahydromethanopterin reductase-like flavin-dependent oxidoreductase (luciferase family)
MRKSFADRGRLMNELIDVLLKAWSGDPFDYHGETIRVTPVPVTRPHPNVVLGGSARATARRAARFGLPLDLPAHLPEIKSYYEELCRERGIAPRVAMVPRRASGPVFIAEDPERAWAELGPHFLWEAVNYGRWARADMSSHMHTSARTLEEVRDSGLYRILAPEECVSFLAGQGTQPRIVFHPLCGGIPLEPAAECLRLFAERVLPAFERGPAAGY